MLEVLKVRDGNNYKNPHIWKQKLGRSGILPRQQEVSPKLIEATHRIFISIV